MFGLHINCGVGTCDHHCRCFIFSSMHRQRHDSQVLFYGIESNYPMMLSLHPLMNKLRLQISMQYAARGMRHAARGMRHAVFGMRHVVYGMPHAVYSMRCAARGMRHAVSGMRYAETACAMRFLRFVCNLAVTCVFSFFHCTFFFSKETCPIPPFDDVWHLYMNTCTCAHSYRSHC